MKNNFLSKVLIFGMLHHLVDLYQVCSNYVLGAKNGTAARVTIMSYIGLYRENMSKTFF